VPPRSNILGAAATPSTATLPGGSAGLTARSHIDVHNRRASIERIGKLSDSILKLGPFGIGLDGILAWVPGVGQVYSLGAGLFLLMEGARARVPASAVLKVASIVLLRTGIDTGNFIPGVNIASGVLVDLFRGHKWAADILTKAIDATTYIEGPLNRAHPAYVEARRRGQRVVFLG
jgi:hypothetical protein